MADFVTVSTGEAEALIRKLAAKLTKANFDKVALRLGGIIGAAAESRARQYPKPKRKKLEKIYTLDVAFGRKVKPYKSIFKSAKQASFVMLSIKAGKLVIPTQRTGSLGKSITHRVDIIGNRVVITIGSNRRYAKFVIGLPPEQSHFHQGVWTPLQTAISSNDAMDEYRTLLKTNLTALIAGLLKE